MARRGYFAWILVSALWLSSLTPVWGAIPESIPSQFMTLPDSQQNTVEALKSLYRQVEGQWQVLRLDPDVPEDEIRERLNFVSSNLQRIERIRQQVSAGENSKNIENYLDSDGQKDLLQRSYFDLIHAQIQMLPSRRVELRGALLDAGMLPRNADAMRRLMKRFKDAGFNAVYPEVFRRGYALFPNPIVALDPELPPNMDMLKLVTDAAQAEGLEVYPWFWMFRVLSPTIARQNPLTRRLPALMANPLDGEAYRSTNSEIEDESTSFMSPASHEWRELLAGLMNQTAAKYNVQGFLMDYIRYGNNQVEDELSLTRFQLDYYRKVGSFPSPRIAPDSDLQSQWHLWREEQVHSMVKDLRLLFGQQKKPLDLGGAVFRNEIQARNSKMQNWRHWSDNHWINFISPMMYTSDFRDLDLWMEWETDQETRNDVIYPIIGAHKMGQNSLELLNQVQMLRHRHANGVSVFASSQLTGNMLKALQIGPFKQKAIAPHHDLVQAMLSQVQFIRQWMNDMADRAAKTQGLNKNNQQTLREASQRLKTLNATLAEKNLRASAQSMVNSIEAEYRGIQEQTQVFPFEIRQRIVHHYGDLLKLARNYKQSTDDKGYVPPSNPPSKVLPEARPLPRMEIPYTSTAPAIDGRLDEEVWQKAYQLPQFFWNTGSARATTSTEVRVTHDDKALYVAYINDEPRNDRVNVSYRPDQQFLNTDDTVQLFLDPEGKGKNYYYFVVNPANVRYQRASFDSQWNRPWQSAARQFSHGWIVEMAIPFSSLGSNADKPWKGNFCRRRPQEIADFHCWSFTYGGVHRLDRLGQLQFTPAK